MRRRDVDIYHRGKHKHNCIRMERREKVHTTYSVGMVGVLRQVPES